MELRAHPRPSLLCYKGGWRRRLIFFLSVSEGRAAAASSHRAGKAFPKKTICIFGPGVEGRFRTNRGEKVDKMASGVKVSDEVVCCFNEMKVRKSCSHDEVKKRKKAILFKISDDQTNIVVHEGKEILVGDVEDGKVQDPLQAFIDMLPTDNCCYALYDASFETKETKKQELIFIHWAPDDAPIRQKMLYASSKAAIRKKLGGIKHEWQVTAVDELKDLSELGVKLGSGVTSLESRKI
ncbi:cofilin-2-like [Heterodontus francisci]|uniref:cofilin-2-like n=1 Tax=Heterodontus francisci TaxID=7792 RepID=UPI00355BEACD